MSEPVEGIWKCTVLGGEAAADDRDIMVVRVNVQIDDGPDKGRRISYEEQVNNKSAKYVAMSAKAVGWKGGRLEATFRGDVESWIRATGGASTVEIQHIERKKGKQAGTMWGKARSIGRGPRALKAPSQQAANDADEAMRRAMAEDAGAYDDAPTDYVPGPSDDDAPPFEDRS